MSNSRDSNLVAQRLAHVFLNRGGSGTYTKLFDDFNIDIRNHVAAVAQFTEGEIPAILCYWQIDHWCVITTHQIAGQALGSVYSVGSASIKHVTLSLQSRHKVLSTNPLDTGSIEVHTEDKTIAIEVEAGRSMIAFLNAIRTIALMNLVE